MSTHIKILGQQDIQDFDAVPELSGEDRKKFFYIPMWAKEILENLRTPVNKVGFVLQLGYFMASNKFFSSKSFDQQDVNFIVAKLPTFRSRINLSNYTDTNLKRHKEIILRGSLQEGTKFPTTTLRPFIYLAFQGKTDFRIINQDLYNPL